MYKHCFVQPLYNRYYWKSCVILIRFILLQFMKWYLKQEREDGMFAGFNVEINEANTFISNFCDKGKSLLKHFVSTHFYIYPCNYKVRQEVCATLGIETDTTKVLNPS